MLHNNKGIKITFASALNVYRRFHTKETAGADPFLLNIPTLLPGLSPLSSRLLCVAVEAFFSGGGLFLFFFLSFIMTGKL